MIKFLCTFAFLLYCALGVAMVVCLLGIILTMKEGDVPLIVFGLIAILAYTAAFDSAMIFFERKGVFD